MTPTKLQQETRDENWAIFQLKGMLGNLSAVRRINDPTINIYTRFLLQDIETLIKEIKHKQSTRKIKSNG